MTGLPRLLVLRIVLILLFKLTEARPSLYARDDLAPVTSTTVIPSMFVPEDEWMTQESCVAESRLSAREIQDITIRAATGFQGDTSIDSAFVDLLHSKGFNTNKITYLGGGKCGKVFSVKKHDTIFAAKITTTHPSCSGKLLLGEDTAMYKSKEHPNIVQRYKLLSGPTPGKLKKMYGDFLYIMITEFCKRGSLVIDGSIQLKRYKVVAQLQGIWSALLQIRSRGYYHRDIKPDNIMVQAGGVWKLGDFGSASTSRYGPFWGTRAYGPPEALYDPNKTMDLEKVDVFAFAVTMLEALYQKKMFTKDGGEIPHCLAVQCWRNKQMGPLEVQMFAHMLNANAANRADMKQATQYIYAMK